MTPQDFLSKEQVSGPALKSVFLSELSGMIPPAHCWYALKARRSFRCQLCPAPPVTPERAVTALPRSSLSVNPVFIAPFIGAKTTRFISCSCVFSKWLRPTFLCQ